MESSNGQTLFALTEQMSGIETALEESGGEMTPEIEDLWAETKDSLAKKTDAYDALVNKLAARSAAIKAEQDRLAALRKTTDNALKRVKEHLRDTMDTFGVRTLEGQFCRISLTETTATEVDEDEALQPWEEAIAELERRLPDYMDVDVKVSKTRAKEAAKALPDGVSLPGVKLVRNKSLRFK